MKTARPITLMIAALGGEGGSLLANWIIGAARLAHFPVQGTSVPGVAQRTGATTYYVEIWPQPERQEKYPVFALMPTPGQLDVMMATELLEAARAVDLGWVSSDKTHLIASTHRVFTIQEKSAMGDARYEPKQAIAAVRQAAKKAILFDMESVLRRERSVINAVMLGALAATDLLPISRDHFEHVIRNSGVAVESNLRGVSAGYAAAKAVLASEPQPSVESVQRGLSADIRTNAIAEFPPKTHVMIQHGLARLLDYQDRHYAQLYLDRLQPILAADEASGGASDGYKLTSETARHLALRMTYEDIIRVADLKTRAARFERVRQEAGAKQNELVAVTEFLKPGVEEVCALLPPALSRFVLRKADESGLRNKLNVGVHLRTSSISGFVLLWLMGRMRRMRRWTQRYNEEQKNITEWLNSIYKASRIDHSFAVDIVSSARLIKGYGSTYSRGIENYKKIRDILILPAIDRNMVPETSIKSAVDAALADPDGFALSRELFVHDKKQMIETQQTKSASQALAQ